MTTMEAIVINSDSEDEKVTQKEESRSSQLPVCKICKGICGSPDNVPLLPPPASQSPLDSLFSRSRLRAPKRPLQTLVELFPVINDVNREFRAMLGKEFTEANVMRFIQYYIRTMRKLQEQVHKYPNKCRALSRNVCRTLLLIKRMSTNVIEQQTPYYMQKICELLAIYMFLELRYASSYAESKAKAVERIVNNILLHLESPDITYVLRIFAYIPFVGKESYIISRVFQRLIPIVVSDSKNEFSDRLYVQYLIAFYHWKDSETLPNCQENVIALANAFMKPKRTLKSSIVYARHLPCYEKRENATRYFLTNLVFFNDLRNASLLDGVAVMVDDTIDLSDEVEVLCTDYSELELNTEDQQNVVKKESVPPRITGTVDLTEEEETPWLTSLARTARDREINLTTIQRKTTPEVIELDSSDEEPWLVECQNQAAVDLKSVEVEQEKRCSPEATDETSRTSLRASSSDLFFDLPEDSTSDVLLRAAITGTKKGCTNRKDDVALIESASTSTTTEKRLNFEGIIDEELSLPSCTGSSSLLTSSQPVSVSENVPESVNESLSPSLSAASSSSIENTRTIESSSACSSANTSTSSRANVSLNTSAGDCSSATTNTSPNPTLILNSCSGTCSSPGTSANAIISETQPTEIEENVISDLETSVEITEETESDKQAKGRAIVADILTTFSDINSPTSSEKVNEHETEQMDESPIGESTIDDSTAAPKEAVTLNLETYTNSFICGEENDEFLRYYDTRPPVKTYLRKTPKRSETQPQRDEDPSPCRSSESITASPSLPLEVEKSTVEERAPPTQSEEKEAPVASTSEKATETDDNIGEEVEQIQEQDQSQDSIVSDDSNVLFSRKVISLREEECSNGRVTPSYLKVPESIEVSSQGSNVVFSMQGRRLSSFPPLQVSSPNHHMMPDFDADFFSEGEESVQNTATEVQVTPPAVTTLPKTIIKPHDAESEKPTTKRRNVWFSDKNEVREFAPRDELSEFTMQPSLINISASTNTLNATKQQFTPSTSHHQQQQHHQSTSTSHQPQQPSAAINAYKSSTATACPSSTPAATTTAINSILLKKSTPPTATATTTTASSSSSSSPSSNTASLKSAQEKALLRELFPNLFVASDKTENEIISEITDMIKTSASNQKKLASIISGPKKSATSHGGGGGKSRSTSSSCVNYRINHNLTVTQIENRRKSSNTPVPGKQHQPSQLQTLSEFDRYLLNLEKRRNRANTQSAKDSRAKPRRKRASSSNRKDYVQVKNIKSLVDITSDIKLNKLRTRVVIERAYEHIIRAILRRHNKTATAPPAQTLVPVAEATESTVTANPTSFDEETAMTITAATTAPSPAVPEETTLPPMIVAEDPPQPDPVEKVNQTEFVEEKQPNPLEPIIKLPTIRPETKSLGDILTDIVEQEVIAQVVKEKVLPMLAKEPLPQLPKETPPSLDLPEPFVLSKSLEEKTQSTPLSRELVTETTEAVEKGLPDNDEIPMEPVHASVCVVEQQPLADTPPPAVDSTVQSDEEKAPEALIDLPQPPLAPVPSEEEVKPPVEADPSKAELKPIKLEDVDSEMAASTSCGKTARESVTIPDACIQAIPGADVISNELPGKVKESPISPVRLEVAEEIEVQTEPPIEAPEDQLTLDCIEESVPDVGIETEVQYTEEEPATTTTSEEAKEIKIRLKRYEQLRGEKYIIVSNSGNPERRASSSSEGVCSTKRRRPNRIVSDDEDTISAETSVVTESNAKKEVVLKKIFERYRAEEIEKERNRHRRENNNQNVNNGVPLGHNIESISTPPPTPPSRSLSPPPSSENKSLSKSVSDSGRPRGEQNNNHSRQPFVTYRRPKPNPTLSSYLSSNSDMIQEFRKHVNMPTEVEIDSNSLAFFYEYLIERKDDRAMEEINKIMPLLKAIDSSKKSSSHRRRFDSCSLPLMRRARKHSSSEIHHGNPAKESSSTSVARKRRKTICSDSHYLLSSPDFDEDICSSQKAADSPTAEVMRLHSGNRIGLLKNASKLSETVTSTTVGSGNECLDEVTTTQRSQFPIPITNGCSSTSPSTNVAASPSPSIPSLAQHKPHSDQERSRKQTNRRTKCESPPDKSRSVVVSRTYSKSNMVQHVFVPPEIEKFIEEEASTVVESTTSSSPLPKPPPTAFSSSSSPTCSPSSSSTAAIGSTAPPAAATSSPAFAVNKKTPRINAGSSSKARKVRRIADLPDTDEEDDNDDSNDEDFNYEKEIKELRNSASSSGRRSRKKTTQTKKRRGKKFLE